MHQIIRIRFRLGLRPRTRWESLQHFSPDPILGFQGPISKGMGGEGKEWNVKKEMKEMWRKRGAVGAYFKEKVMKGKGKKKKIKVERREEGEGREKKGRKIACATNDKVVPAPLPITAWCLRHAFLRFISVMRMLHVSVSVLLFLRVFVVLCSICCRLCNGRR